MKKFRLFFDFEKEEIWLNEMAKQGWKLTGKSMQYKFRKGVPKNESIKIDYHTFKTKADFEDYCSLFSDSGWEHIAGTRTSGTQYFKRINSSGDADIFSDIPSKAARYRRLSKVWLSIAISYVPIFIALILTKAIDISAFLNPKSLYYTPGLWEKSGAYFLKAFLFETPFAIMRGFTWLLFPVLIIGYIIFSAKAEICYRKIKLDL